MRSDLFGSIDGVTGYLLAPARAPFISGAAPGLTLGWVMLVDCIVMQRPSSEKRPPAGPSLLQRVNRGGVAVMAGPGRCRGVPGLGTTVAVPPQAASRIARFLNAAQARLAAAGVRPRWLITVEVTGRRSGKTIRFPAVIADYDNGRYMVSYARRGRQPVRNVRVSGRHTVLRHGNREPVMLQEVDVDQRAPILRCYLQPAPGLEHTFLSIAGRPLRSSGGSQRDTRCSG